MNRFTNAEIERLRSETPGCHQRAHFNNAGAGLMPQAVLSAIQNHFQLEAEIGGYEAADACREAIGQCYAAVGNLLGCRPGQIAFTENATAAYAQALSCIAFAAGDVILTTNEDYSSNQIMFLSLKKRFGVEVVRTPPSPGGGVDLQPMGDLMAKLRPKLVAVTQVPTNSGLVQPVAAIGKLCRSLDLLYLVDACQSVGQMPVDVNEIGCDFLSATSRKFLRGPRGNGFLYVSDRVTGAGLEPLFLDLHGAHWEAPDRYEVAPGARRFENWEFAFGLVLGTGVAARYATDIGLERIRDRVRLLADQIRLKLAAVEGYRILDFGPETCGIVTTTIPAENPKVLLKGLRDQGINTSLSPRNYALIDFDQKGVEWALRISPHYYNTEAEIEKLMESLQRFSG